MYNLILPKKRLSFLYFIFSQSELSCPEIIENRFEWLSCGQKYLLGIKSELFLTFFLLPHVTFVLWINYSVLPFAPQK